MKSQYQDSCIERVEDFKYLETTLTNQNSIQEEIKSTLKSGKAWYHWVRNFLSSSLLSNNLKIKIYINKILPVVLYGCETWSLTLTEGFPCFSSVLRQMPRQNLQRCGTACTLSKCLCCSMYCLFCVVCVLFVCKCVLYYCQRVATQLQLTNI